MGEYDMQAAIRQFLRSSRLSGDMQVFQIEEVWETIMGKTVARYTEKLRIVNHTLYVTTSVGPLRQELVYQKETIRRRVNEALGASTITDVVIQ